jgi:hypothetical protein
MSGIQVGGEIEAWCTSCKTEKWHVVVAMVGGKPAKVECHGCHKQHVYREHAPGTKTEKAPRAPRARAAAAEPAAPLEDVTAELKAGAASARPFNVRERFAVGDFLRHPTFGVGKVTALPAPQKMEVAFLDGRKLLMHDRGEGAGKESLQKPVRKDDEPGYVTDAPPRK